MALPLLKLNLAPAPGYWRRHHEALGWALLAAGALALAAILGLTWRARRQAVLAGREAVARSREARQVQDQERGIQDRLGAIDVQKELPRWKLAERILLERGIPWSRTTAELERSLPQDVRLRSIQRTRSDQRMELKIKGEARSREAEAALVEGLQKNAFFAQVVLERESESPGGGVEFELALPLAVDPPAYVPLPRYGPARAQAALPAKAAPRPVAQAAAKPAPAPAPSPAPAKTAPVQRSKAPAVPSAAPAIQVRPVPETRPQPPAQRAPGARSLRERPAAEPRPDTEPRP